MGKVMSGTSQRAMPRRTRQPDDLYYTDDEREFMIAMERYKRTRRRPYPTAAEALAVAKSLGWQKVALPDYPLLPLSVG